MHQPLALLALHFTNYPLGGPLPFGRQGETKKKRGGRRRREEEGEEVEGRGKEKKKFQKIQGKYTQFSPSPSLGLSFSPSPYIPPSLSLSIAGGIAASRCWLLCSQQGLAAHAASMLLAAQAASACI